MKPAAVWQAASFAWSVLLTFACSRHESAASEPTAAPTASSAVPAKTTAVATGAQAAPSAPSSSSVTKKPSALCEQVCERTRGLHCKDRNGCLANCTMMAALEPCDQQFSAFYGCLAQEPLPHWECSPEGVPAIRDGYCEHEQAAASSCLEQQVDK